MATKILADINEMAFTLACGNQPIAKDAEEVYFIAADKLPLGANNFGLTCDPKNSVFLVPGNKNMLDNGEHLRELLNKTIVTARGMAKVDEFKIDIKVQQAIQAANALKQQLAHPNANLQFPGGWGVPFTPPESLLIRKAGWTPREASFEEFCKLCGKDETHNNNPADTLLLVQNSDGEEFILGVSLKATFGKADITMYNGGVCAFYYIVIGGNNLAVKTKHCPCTSQKMRTSTACPAEAIIKEPYTTWLERDMNRYFKELSKKQAKAVWTTLVTDVIENNKKGKRRTLALALTKGKLDALSGVRDAIWKTMLDMWGPSAPDGVVVAEDGKSFKTTLSNDVARKIIGGLFQFTHNNIQMGRPNVPYIKSTSFLNYIGKFTKFKKEMADAGYSENPIVLNTSISEKFETPDLSKYVPEGADVEILIVKIAAVSILFCIKKDGDFTQYFTIRAKLESKPPSGIKIDIKPVAHKLYPQKGGGITNTISCLHLNTEQKEILENIWDMTYPDCPWNDDLDEALPEEQDSFYASCHDDIGQMADDESGGGGGDEGGGDGDEGGAGGEEVSVQNFFGKLSQIVRFYKESLAPYDAAKTREVAATLNLVGAEATRLRYERRTALKEMHANLNIILKKLAAAISDGCLAEAEAAAAAAESKRLAGAAKIAGELPDVVSKAPAKVKTADGGCSIMGGRRRRRRRRKKTRRRGRGRRTRHKKRRRRSRKKRHKKRTRRRHRTRR